MAVPCDRIVVLAGLAYKIVFPDETFWGRSPTKLTDKVAIVTGSVRGIGWEIAHAYAQENTRVVICDLLESDVDEAVARLGLPAERVLGVLPGLEVAP